MSVTTGKIGKFIVALPKPSTPRNKDIHELGSILRNSGWKAMLIFQNSKDFLLHHFVSDLRERENR